MRRFLVLLLMVFASAVCVAVARAETPEDTTEIVEPAGKRLIPVWKLSPTGVRIRSVRDNRKVIIVNLPPAAPTAREYSLVDSAVRGQALTRSDLEQMETRLKGYFDRRLLELERASKLREAGRDSFTVGSYTPGEMILTGMSPGATNIVFVPMPVFPGSPIDTVRLAAEIAARLSDAQRAAVVRGESLSSAYFVPPRDTAVVTSRALEAGTASPDTTRLGPLQGARAPDTKVRETERATLDTGMLRAITILFESNSANLNPASLSALNALGHVLERHPDVRLHIRGHTDSSGSAEYNQELSRRRAEAVREYLVENFLISRARLVAKGYGESIPVASEETATGRALNRRVEFVGE
jgi:outer membrane protein OmpA-like peptidoglycan-associated protein